MTLPSSRSSPSSTTVRRNDDPQIRIEVAADPAAGSRVRTAARPTDIVKKRPLTAITCLPIFFLARRFAAGSVALPAHPRRPPLNAAARDDSCQQRLPLIAVASLETLTAVVVDWNLPDLTIRCVESLVADGVSLAGSSSSRMVRPKSNWALISAALPRCVLVRVVVNAGFARATNIGAAGLPRAAPTCLVNNDATPRRPGTVAALLDALARPGVGIVVPAAPEPRSSLQPSVVPFTTPLPALVRASGLSRFVPGSLATWCEHALES